MSLNSKLMRATTVCPETPAMVTVRWAIVKEALAMVASCRVRVPEDALAMAAVEGRKMALQQVRHEPVSVSGPPFSPSELSQPSLSHPAPPVGCIYIYLYLSILDDRDD